MEPVYVVVRIRRGRFSEQWRRRVSTRGKIPLFRINAIMTSMESADFASSGSWLHRFGSPGALVKSVVSSNGMSGSGIGLLFRQVACSRMACSTVPGSTTLSMSSTESISASRSERWRANSTPFPTRSPSETPESDDRIRLAKYNAIRSGASYGLSPGTPGQDRGPST